MMRQRTPVGRLSAALLGLLAFSLSSLAGAAPFHNVTNKPFATRCNGPQGAIVVPKPAAGQLKTLTAAKTSAQVQAQHNVTWLKRAAASYERVCKAVPRKKKGTVRFPRVEVQVQNGQLVLPNLVQAQQTGTPIGNPSNNLTFTYQGWSDADKAALQTYLATAYPKAKLIYGPPAFNITVNIVQDNTIQDIQGGVYDVSTNEIRMPKLSGNFPEDSYILLLLVLNAFHDDAIFYYDSWEQGFIGAAAYVIQTQPGVSPGFDPIDPGPFYCLSVYEPENQPELGNSTFYPASGATNMLVWRIGMARAAWLKCWIENNAFFSQFNQAYYQNYNSSLPGDIPTLKEIAAGVVPTVEGIPFAEWYERQYVLDTSVRLGQKLFTWNIPLKDAVALICELYETLPDGNERPFGGQARTTYWSYDSSSQLYAEEGNLIDIAASGTTPGEGFLLPTFYNIGGPQRVNVQIDVANLRRNYIYPYGERGFQLTENNLYGAVLGTNTGKLNVTGGTQLITDLTVDRGVWGSRVTAAALTPRQIEVTFRNAAGQPVARKFNIGWDSYCCLIDSGTLAAANHTYSYNLNGMYLMSLPLQPVSADASAVLGIPANQLLLAWWDPLRQGDDKYRLWPSFIFRNPGNGYWLRVLQDVTVNLEGIQVDTTQPYEVTVGGGWNIIGNPRLNPVALKDIQVRQGDGQALSWANAVKARLVQDSLFGYNQSTGYEVKDTLQPWLGYWMRCLTPTGVTLIFPPVTSTSSVRSGTVSR